MRLHKQNLTKVATSDKLLQDYQHTILIKGLPWQLSR